MHYMCNQCILSFTLIKGQYLIPSCWDALNGRVEGSHQQLLTDVIFPEHSQEVQIELSKSLRRANVLAWDSGS